MERIYCHIVAPVWTMRHPDMAAGWLTAFVRHHGWQVEPLDLNAELYWLENRPDVKDCWPRLYVSMNPEQFTQAVLEAHGEHIRRRVKQMVELGCGAFGLLVTTGNARFVAALSEMIKEIAPEAWVVAGGPGVTSLFRYRRYYRRRQPLMPHSVERDLSGGHAIDYWVLGEGEQTLLDLLERLQRGEHVGDGPGLVRTGERMFDSFREQPLIKQLDSLPLVDFEGFDLSRYDYQALPFQLSRGCAFARCSHCGLKGYSRGFRVRSSEHGMAELRQNIERHGIREFHFVDLAINGDLERLEGFCDAVIASGFQFRWECFFQIRPDMTFDLLRKVVDSGCYGFNYGFESGSDAVLRTMRKPYDSEGAARVLKMTREAGGRTCINVMVGHPGETEQEFQRTLDFLSANVQSISIVGGAAITEMQLHSPLLEDSAHFGVQMVGTERNNWRSVDGSIDWRVRNDRIHRLTEHLRTLGIPCFEAYWDPLPEGYPPVAELPDDAVEITGVVVTAPDVDPEQPSKVELPLLIHVGYRAMPAVTMAVFDLEISDLAGQPVFSTPSPTHRLRAVEVHREGWVRMALGPYDLPPGQYMVTATARSFHQQERVFDRYIHRIPVTMVGAPYQRPKVVTPYTWTHSAGHLAPPSGSPLRQVRVYQGGDPLRTDLREGAGPAVVELRLAGEAVADGSVDLILRRSDGHVLHHGSSPPISFDEQGRIWRCSLDQVPLCAGPHELELTLHAGPVDFSSRHHLLVQSIDAQGLVRLDLRPRWRPEAVGAEPAELRRPGEGALAPGAALTLSLGLADLPPGEPTPVTCRLGIEDREGRLVALATDHAVVVSPGGTAGVEVDFDLPLLDGEYSLKAGLWSGEQLLGLVRSFELKVESRRTAGGGLVHAPHRMTVGGTGYPHTTCRNQ